MTSNPAVDFIDALKKRVDEFAMEYNIPIKSINFEEVTDSDWCKRCIVLWAYVPTDWEPPINTVVLNQSYSNSHFPWCAYDIRSYIEGRGKTVNVERNPPKNPHKLYRTIKNN